MNINRCIISDVLNGYSFRLYMIFFLLLFFTPQSHSHSLRGFNPEDGPPTPLVTESNVKTRPQWIAGFFDYAGSRAQSLPFYRLLITECGCTQGIEPHLAWNGNVLEPTNGIAQWMKTVHEGIRKYNWCLYTYKGQQDDFDVTKPPSRRRLVKQMLGDEESHNFTEDVSCSVREMSDAFIVTELGKLSIDLSAYDEQNGTDKKWTLVREIIGTNADRVIIKQLGANLGRNTSVRNELPLIWKDKGYFRRARDLGQVFLAPQDFTLDAIVLRTGNANLALLPGAADAKVFVQFFEVTGTPVINDNGTPPGTEAKHGFSTNHRCDDFVEGVHYKSILVVTGGRLPNLAAGGDPRLTYMKWAYSASRKLKFEKNKRYAFMIGFVEPAPERNFTLANRNNASSPREPAMVDGLDTYPGGWGLRREGSAKTPPLKVPGEQPPTNPETLHQLKTESSFPEGKIRYNIQPTCEGYPDVDTYRDLEFYIIQS